jgi:hypothetical protein
VLSVTPKGDRLIHPSAEILPAVTGRNRASLPVQYRRRCDHCLSIKYLPKGKRRAPAHLYIAEAFRSVCVAPRPSCEANLKQEEAVGKVNRLIAVQVVIEMNRPTTPFVWPLIKISLFWFLCGRFASRLAVTFGLPPVPFIYIATAAFALYAASLWFRTALSDGVDTRLRFGAVAGLLIGILIFASLRQINVHPSLSLLMTEHPTNATVEGSSFRAMRPIEHLAEATRLVFESHQQAALAEARRHLASIQTTSPEYPSAEALKRIIEKRSDEWSGDAGRDFVARPIEVVARARTSDGLRLVLRNNGKRSVMRIRYRLSYFRAADGWYLPPDRQSEIAAQIRPSETRTVDISDNLLKRGSFYASFDLESWQLSPTS